MKRRHEILFIFATLLGLAWSGSGAVVLDDDWDDGDRTDTNLPEESAWFANNAAGSPTLTAGVGSLIGNVLMFETNVSSRLWITHFTEPGSPVELAVGETLKVTLVFTATNIATAPSTGRGLRIGLYNFSEPDAARVSADGFSTGAGGGAPGANVTGYMLNMNFVQSFTVASPLQIMDRTDLPNVNLMGASAAFTSLSSGGGLAGDPGFSNVMEYTFEFSVRRDEASADITTKFSDTNGWSISHTATDSLDPRFRFDGFAVRPNSVADSAESFTFRRMKVEVLPFSFRITSIEFLPFEARITWEAIASRTYQLEWRNALDPMGTWTPFEQRVTAMGNSASLSDPDAIFEPRRFYRVFLLPLQP